MTAVGGTQLKQSAGGTFSQVVWNDTFDVPLQQAFTGTDGPNPFATGGGVSEFFSGRSTRIGVADDRVHRARCPRACPDISMSGACDGAVTIYNSYPGGVTGWHLICGTSEATPLFSGIVALADQVAHHRLGLINPTLYALSALHAPGLVDVTSGNNTVAFTQGADNPVHRAGVLRGAGLRPGVRRGHDQRGALRAGTGWAALAVTPGCLSQRPPARNLPQPGAAVRSPTATTLAASVTAR